MSLRLIIADDESLERSKTGTIWGRVYFQNGDQSFPEHGWTDMAVPFLNAWLEALIRIATATASTHEEIVWFMDGPFKVILSARGDEAVEVSLMHKEITDQSINIAFADLLQNAVSLGQRLVTVCKQRGWFGQDQDTLMLAETTKRGADILAQPRG